MIYDAIIIGASIAGLHCALKLSQNGWKVKVIDRKEKIGIPVCCGEATGNIRELQRFFPVSPRWISRMLSGMSIHVNTNTPFTKEIEDFGVILNRDIFEQDLASQAMNNGAEIELRRNFTGLHYDKKICTGINIDNNDIIQGKIIIGADGVESMVGRCAGITHPLPLSSSFPSVQYTLHTTFDHHDMLHFYIGSHVIPKGYLWVFPKDTTHLSIGAGTYGTHPNKPLVYLDQFINHHFPNAKKKDLICGNAPLALTAHKLSQDNIVVVGDAARQVNPLTVSGIMNALEASDCLSHILVTYGPSISHKQITQYSRRWNLRNTIFQHICHVLKEAICTMDDQKLFSLVEISHAVFSKPIDRQKRFHLPLPQLVKITILSFPHLLPQMFSLVKKTTKSC